MQSDKVGHGTDQSGLGTLRAARHQLPTSTTRVRRAVQEPPLHLVARHSRRSNERAQGVLNMSNSAQPPFPTDRKRIANREIKRQNRGASTTERLDLFLRGPLAFENVRESRMFREVLKSPTSQLLNFSSTFLKSLSTPQILNFSTPQFLHSSISQILNFSPSVRTPRLLPRA